MMTKYSFDDYHIGILRESGRSLETRELKRPMGLSKQGWYSKASRICSILNTEEDQDGIVKRIENTLRDAGIEIEIGGCRCCGSPYLEYLERGEVKTMLGGSIDSRKKEEQNNES